MNEIYKKQDWYKNAGLTIKKIIDNPKFKTIVKNENTFLSGSYGIGKTVSCYGLLRDWIINRYEKLLLVDEQAMAEIYLTKTWVELIKFSTIKTMLHDYQFEIPGTEKRTKAFYTLYHDEFRLHNATILVIDDFNNLKSGSNSEFYNVQWNDYFYDLFDYRYTNKLTTIFTSNQSLHDILKISNNTWLQGQTIDRLQGIVQNDTYLDNEKSLRYK
jgi:DNA replication protein DnaC